MNATEILKEQVDPDTQFKIQHKKYIQQKLNRKKQMIKLRKQQFGDSSSSSQEEENIEVEVKNNTKQVVQQKIQISTTQQGNKITQQELFRKQHQQYLKQKLERKREMIKLRKQRFGSSSSDDDDNDQTTPISNDQKLKTSDTKQMSVSSKSQQLNTKQIKIYEKPQLKVQKELIQNNLKQSNTTIKLQIVIQTKKSTQWIDQTVTIKQKKLSVPNQNLEMIAANINKIKLLFTNAIKDFYKVKITHKTEDIFIGVSMKSQIAGLPAYYYIFSKIIQDKLSLLGLSVKTYKQETLPNIMGLKNIPAQIQNSSLIYGNILKKSQLLGKWELRFISINDEGIYSYKKLTDKPSMFIQSNSIKQMWTRFDIQQKMLVIKLMYNSTKTEFGIPISYFMDKCNWLYFLYRVTSQKK